MSEREVTEREVSERDEHAVDEYAVDECEVGEYAVDGIRAAVATMIDADRVARRRTDPDVRRIEAGRNAVYAVTLADDADAVLKVGTRTPGRFPVESLLLEFVAERTEVPVPTVHASVSTLEGPLAHPAVLLSKPVGSTYECDPRGIGRHALGRVCADAGRNLGALHAATEAAFDAYGPLGPADDVRDGHRNGSDDASLDGIGLQQRYETWPELFADSMRYTLEQLAESRFAGLAQSLAAEVDRLADELATHPSGTEAPVVAHCDYRLGNLLVDPGRDDGPITTSVLDWGGAAAGDPEYDLVRTATLLTSWPGYDDAVRSALRERVFEAYASVRHDPRDEPGFGTRRRRYRLHARLNRLRHADAVTEQFGPSETAAWLAEQRAAVEAHCTG